MKPLFSIGKIQNIYKDFVNQKIDKAFESLSYIGEQIVNDARNSGEYTDRTGNLRSSIGYFIAKDGRIESERIEKANKDEDSEGVNRAKRYAKELLNMYNTGLVLVVFAGMEYAASVESKGFDVITGSVQRSGNIGNKLKSLLK